MEAWFGFMDWPLDANWKCEICEGVNLVWGLAHGTCRCEICHTQYSMRDEKGKSVKVPICQLKDEYYQPAKRLYQKLKTPMTKWSKEQWNEALKEVKDETHNERAKDNRKAEGTCESKGGVS